MGKVIIMHNTALFADTEAMKRPSYEIEYKRLKRIVGTYVNGERKALIDEDHTMDYSIISNS